MKVPFYYCNIDNFGDKLNEDLMKYFLDTKIKSSSIKHSYAMGIGSLLDNILLDKNDKQFDRKPLKILSSGFGFEEGGFFHNKDIIIPEKLKKDVFCYALRGELTKSRIEKLTGKKCNAVLGDAGLLSHLLIDKNSIEKKYDLGIVPHFADSQNPIWNEIQNKIPNSKILDVKKTPKAFLKDLCECKIIISSAMHPLIASDALRIPNIWVRISEETTSRYKFEDYYSALKLEKEPLNLKEQDFDEKDLISILENYDVSDQIIEKIQNELLEAFNLFKKDYKKDKIKIFIDHILKKITK